MAFKTQQPTMLVDDTTGVIGFKNPVTGKDTGMVDPANAVLAALNATPIGNTTPSTGVFTTLASTALFTESAQNGITAFAGGGQASATQLTLQTSRVTTVATRGDSVKLPTASAGLELVVINTGASPMSVFPIAGDAINGLAANTAVLQMQSSIDVYSCGAVGQWHVEVGGGYSASLLTELSEDNITAFAGGGQASARQLTSQTNRISTVATLGDSIKMPPSAAGLEITIINRGANACQVFGAGTDLIDDVATATGVSQMASSVVIYICATAGNWYTEGLATGFGGPGLQTASFNANITAFAGGGQASATPLSNMINRVATVGTSGDSVKLPVSAAGLTIQVSNSGANPMQVYGAGTDTINGVATATGVIQMQNSVATYLCLATGVWQTEGIGTGFSGSFPTVTAQNNITATAGGVQGTALLLTSVLSRVTVVATALDAVRLPLASPGLQLTVANAAAVNAINIFPAVGDAINAGAANAAYMLPAGKTASFTSAGVGFYQSILSA